MSDTTRQEHWNKVYAARQAKDLTWAELAPTVSLGLIRGASIAPGTPIIDIGSGISHLPVALLDMGFSDLTLLDISSRALEDTRAGLGARAKSVRFITADITEWHPNRHYGLWHDRAVFHFLTTAPARAAYVAALSKAIPTGGHAVIGTFALDGPEICSGLPVQRYSAQGLSETLGPAFALEDSLAHAHQTPGGKTQSFQFARFRRV